MSDQPAPMHSDENDVEIKDGPGHRLSAARQARGLTIEDIAAELHLKPSTIAALEHERYDELPGAVFVTGYMRSYARLLDLDPEPLLDAVRSAGPLGEPRRPRVRRASEPRVDSGHLVMRLVSIAIALIVVGFAFVWWQNQRPLTDLSLEPTLPPIEEATDQPATPEQPPVSEPVAPTVADEPSEPEKDPEQAAALETTPTPDTPQEGTQIESDPATPPVEDQEDEPVPEQSAAPEEEPGEEPTAEEALPASVDIVLEFDGPSWVDIRDSEREYKLFGEMKKGDRHVLGGKPPYSVIIGNASAVQIQIAGAPFDLNAIAKGNVARFTLDPENLP